MFTPYQQKVLTLMSHVDTEEQMKEINDLLSAYFTKKAVDEADRMWDEGKISEQTIQEWKDEHLRTSY